MATHLLATDNGPSDCAQNNLQLSFPCVLLMVITNPQDPHYNLRCFYRYFLNGINIHHATELKSNTEFDIIWINRICFSVSLSQSLAVSWFRITGLDWTIGLNWILMKANGAYIFSGSYQILQSLFLTKWTIRAAKSEVCSHQSDRGWWDRADGLPVTPWTQL